MRRAAAGRCLRHRSEAEPAAARPERAEREMHEYIHSKHNRREGHARRHVKNNGVVPQNDPGYETIFAYDLAGRKTSIQYPADPVTKKYVTVSYEHCPMGVTAVTVNNGASSKDIVQSISYNEFGQMSEVRRGNGSVSYYTYDRKQRLANLKTTAKHNGKTWTVQDVKYSFKTDDSIAEMVNTPDVASDGAVQSSIKYSYQYDGLNRLVRADGSYEKAKVANGQPGVSNVRKFSRGYRYAANGNLTGKTIYDPDTGSADDDWTYTYANHAATAINTTASGTRFQMVYDSVGNMTAQYDHAKHVTKHMVYDSDNRINEVRDAANQVIGSYDYDDQGFRVRKVSKRAVNGADTFIETLSPSMYVTYEKEKTATGRVIRESKKTVNHIYLNGVRIAAVTPGITAVYYLTDQVDSVNVVLNDSGIILSQTEFLPFGETWTQEGDKEHAPKYNSQELDKETGYYFYNARHYDPEIGRFITADNVVSDQYSTQSWNRFSYVRNNPIMYKDPTGHTEEGANIGSLVGLASPIIGGTGIGRFLGDKISDLFSSGKDSTAKSTVENQTRKSKDSVNNRAARYTNQALEISPDGRSSCGPATVSMITGENPQKVANKLGHTTSDEKLTKYLNDKGYSTEKIVDGGSEKTKWSFKPSDKDFDKMRGELDKGKSILYHFSGDDGKSRGHYALLKGYDKKTNEFIFNDPAGDRNKGYFSGKGSGENVRYTTDQLKDAGIKRLFSVSKEEK